MSLKLKNVTFETPTTTFDIGTTLHLILQPTCEITAHNFLTRNLKQEQDEIHKSVQNDSLVLPSYSSLGK